MVPETITCRIITHLPRILLSRKCLSIVCAEGILESKRILIFVYPLLSGLHGQPPELIPATDYEQFLSIIPCHFKRSSESMQLSRTTVSRLGYT